MAQEIRERQAVLDVPRMRDAVDGNRDGSCMGGLGHVSFSLRAARRDGQDPLRQHGSELAAIPRRHQRVLERLDLGARERRPREETRIGRVADQHAFRRRNPNRNGAHAAQRQCSACDAAVGRELEHRRHRDHREVALAARILGERPAVPFPPGPESYCTHDFVRRDRRAHVAGGEIRHRNVAFPVATRYDDRGVERHGHQREFRRGIEMAQTAADRAAVSRLPVPDFQDGLRHQRQPPPDQRRKFDGALRGHRADHDFIAVLSNVGEALDAVEIDQVVGIRDAQVEHRHQRLTAGEHPGIVELLQVAHGFAQRSRQMVLERRRLHRSVNTSGETLR